MRRWRFIKEKFKERLPTYFGETMAVFFGEGRNPYSPRPKVDLVGQDVTTGDRNKTVSPSITYTTGVA